MHNYNTDNDWVTPTLRQLLDESAARVAMPGRYCDRMAFIIDVACDPNGDDTFSAGLGGDWYARFGRRILLVDSRGFVTSQIFPRESVAEAAMEALRNDFAEACDWEI